MAPKFSLFTERNVVIFMVRRLGLGKNNHLTYASLALNPRFTYYTIGQKFCIGFIILGPSLSFNIINMPLKKVTVFIVRLLILGKRIQEMTSTAIFKDYMILTNLRKLWTLKKLWTKIMDWLNCAELMLLSIFSFGGQWRKAQALALFSEFVYAITIIF